MLGAYSRWFNDWALLIGWAVGTVAGTSMAIAANYAAIPQLGGFSFPGYIAFYTVALNLLVAVALTLHPQRGARHSPDDRRDRGGRLSILVFAFKLKFVTFPPRMTSRVKPRRSSASPRAS